MSAGFAALISDRTDIPALTVAGSIRVGGHPFYMPSRKADWPAVFDRSTADFEGHAWVLAGDHVVDLSIFRTARSGVAPPHLDELLQTLFGSAQGAFLASMKTMRSEGMDYEPVYVLTTEQERAMAIGAQAIVKSFGHPNARVSPKRTA